MSKERKMKLVRCVNKTRSFENQIKIGKLYWIDESSIWKDSDGDEYVQVYLDEARRYYVAGMLTSHFETEYRYLNYGESLANYINTHIGFLLKDIIAWCVKELSGNSLACNLIAYIHNNHLEIAENMEKEFVVNSVPFREFAERGMAEEYMKYMGYSLYCVEWE